MGTVSTTLRFDDVGTGEDVLLLIHGHPFNRSMWKSQLHAATSHGWRVIAPDLSGYGQSPVLADCLTMEIYAAQLIDLLDQLRVDRVVIGGLSMGGQVAMALAEQYPERIRGLLLAATFPRSDTAEIAEQRCRLADALVIKGMVEYAKELLPKLLSERSVVTHPDVVRHVVQMMHDTDPAGAAAALRGRAKRHGYQPALRAFHGPALIVVGSDDAYTTGDDAAEMHALLSNSRLVLMEGIGHMPNLESEAEFNTAMIHFLEQVQAHPAN